VLFSQTAESTCKAFLPECSNCTPLLCLCEQVLTTKHAPQQHASHPTHPFCCFRLPSVCFISPPLPPNPSPCAQTLSSIKNCPLLFACRAAAAAAAFFGAWLGTRLPGVAVFGWVVMIDVVGVAAVWIGPASTSGKRQCMILDGCCCLLVIFFTTRTKINHQRVHIALRDEPRLSRSGQRVGAFLWGGCFLSLQAGGCVLGGTVRSYRRVGLTK